MAIPDNVLEVWQKQGAVVTSSSTYDSIKNALSKHEWPQNMNFEVYLQGSYGNSTNIRGDSDVDIVVETSNVFYNNLTDEEKKILGLSPGKFKWDEFRQEVLKALISHYGNDKVSQSNRCIKVSGNQNRLATDIVPACEYRTYNKLSVKASGIMFFDQKDGKRIINYPKLHKKYGQEKNALCRNNYKPSVRMFKNARNNFGGYSIETLNKSYPSYFIECLISNVDEECFSSSLSDTFYNVVDFLNHQRENDQLPYFITQNKQEQLFGEKDTQWTIENAYLFIGKLILLWNEFDK